MLALERTAFLPSCTEKLCTHLYNWTTRHSSIRDERNHCLEELASCSRWFVRWRVLAVGTEEKVKTKRPGANLVKTTCTTSIWMVKFLQINVSNNSHLKDCPQFGQRKEGIIWSIILLNKKNWALSVFLVRLFLYTFLLTLSTIYFPSMLDSANVQFSVSLKQ